MSRRFSYLVLMLCLLLSSCGGETIIPKGELRDIYVDMLLADQWIKESRRQARMADTVYVYRPFLESRGYTEEDFIRTVNLYMENPADFSEFFDDVAETLRSRKKDVEILERGEYIRDSLERARKNTPFRRPDFLIPAALPDSLYLRHLLILGDSTGVYRFYPDSTALKDESLR